MPGSNQDPIDGRLFLLGDVVRLKSGGPKMTISGIHPDNHRRPYGCAYFVNNELHQSMFSERELKKVWF